MVKLWQSIVLGIIGTWATVGILLGFVWVCQNFPSVEDAFGWLFLVALVTLFGAMIGSNSWYERNNQDSGRGY